MTYGEILDYLYAQLPMFHRIGPAAYKPDLSNTIAVIHKMSCAAFTLPARMAKAAHRILSHLPCRKQDTKPRFAPLLT